MQWLKGISSRVLLQEFAPLRRQFWARHFWARGYLAVSSGNLTDEMIQEYILALNAAEWFLRSRRIVCSLSPKAM